MCEHENCSLNAARVSELVSHFPLCASSVLVLKFPSTTLYTYNQSPLGHVLNSVQFLLYKWTFASPSLPREGAPTVQYPSSFFLSVNLRNSLPLSPKFLCFCYPMNASRDFYWKRTIPITVGYKDE